MALEHFTIRDGCAYFRPKGEMSFVPSIVSLMVQAMGECEAARVTRVLVDLTATTQAPMTTLERFEFATAVAAKWDRTIRLAVLGRPDQLDEDRFAELVARNRGLLVKGCTTAEEALAWLNPASS